MKKNKKNFESECISSFINGVRAFFDNESQYPFNENVSFWRNLKDYLYGKQDIYRDKKKLTRPEINNKIVEKLHTYIA